MGPVWRSGGPPERSLWGSLGSRLAPLNARCGRLAVGCPCAVAVAPCLAVGTLAGARWRSGAPECSVAPVWRSGGAPARSLWPRLAVGRAPERSLWGPFGGRERTASVHPFGPCRWARSSLTLCYFARQWDGLRTKNELNNRKDEFRAFARGNWLGVSKISFVFVTQKKMAKKWFGWGLNPRMWNKVVS